MRILGVIIYSFGVLILLTNRIQNSLLINIIGFVLFPLGSFIFRLGKQKNQLSLSDKLNKDIRKPVLFLRTFNRDNQLIKNELGVWEGFSINPILSPKKHFFSEMKLTYEEKIVQIFEKVGPVIALGSPKDNTKLIGASRAYSSNKEWKTIISDLIGRSKIILLLLDFSESVKWELEEIIKQDKTNNLVILIPQINGDSNKIRTDWLESYNIFREDFSILPQLKEHTIGIKTYKKFPPTIITSKKKSIRKRLQDLQVISDAYLKHNL